MPLKTKYITETNIASAAADMHITNFTVGEAKYPKTENNKNKEHDKNNGLLLKTLIIITPLLKFDVNSIVEIDKNNLFLKTA
jgi:hypothetical protein